MIDATRFLTWVLANKHCPCAIFQWISINSHICVHTHVHQIKQNPCHLQVDLNKLPNVHTHTTHMCIRLSIVLAIFRWIFTIPILTCGSDAAGQPSKGKLYFFHNWVWFSSTATITSINMCIKETWMWARWFWQRFTDFDARQTDRHTTNHLKSFYRGQTCFSTNMFAVHCLLSCWSMQMSIGISCKLCLIIKWSGGGGVRWTHNT